MIGAFLGLQGGLLTLIVGSLLGALVGLWYIWFTGKDASAYELPFGTFLGAAALGVAFFGEVFLNWDGRLGAWYEHAKNRLSDHPGGCPALVRRGLRSPPGFAPAARWPHGDTPCAKLDE